MAKARYALTLADGTIANIVAVDLADEKGAGFQKIVEANGHALVPLKDGGTEMGGVTVEPGDRCTDTGKATFQKGALGTKPVDLSIVPIAATEPIDAPAEKV